MRCANTVSLTLAITTRSERLLAMDFAMSIGEVSQAVPSRTEPSGIVTEMGTRGLALEKGYQGTNTVVEEELVCKNLKLPTTPTIRLVENILYQQ